MRKFKYKQVEPNLKYEQLEAIRENNPQELGESQIDYDMRILCIIQPRMANWVQSTKQVSSAKELRENYYQLNLHKRSKGVGRTVKTYRRELREGMTQGDYERDLKAKFPADYAREILLPEARENYPYCYESKSQYLKKIMQIKSEYGLTAKDIKDYRNI
jgi:hypothetical protein